MLKLFGRLKSRVDSSELILAKILESNLNSPVSSRFFSFLVVGKNIELIILTLAADLLKFVIIMTHDSSVGFNILYRQKEKYACPFSYSYYRTLQKKIRTFSVSGLATMVAVGIVSSLLTNLIFGINKPIFASGFGWVQTDWSGGATTSIATHQDWQTGWTGYASKSNQIEVFNSGADLRLIASSSLLAQTSDSDFGLGSFSPVNIAVAGSGVSGYLELGRSAGSTTLQIATGGSHTCVLNKSGEIYCWGYNGYGQLGDNSTLNRLVPTKVATTTVFTSLYANAYHTCALDDAGAAYCWGKNQNGQLGDNSTAQRLAPVKVATTTIFTSLQAGGSHTCALDAAGAAYCWGFNFQGQLGDNSTTSRLTPVKVATTTVFTALALGNAHTCALDAAGVAYCWGYNGYGQLGDNSSLDRLTPVKVATTTVFTAIQTGYSHTCALDAAGAAYCWGFNLYGQFGDGTSGVSRLTPVKVATSTVFTALQLGANNTCALDAAGAAYCWGYNEFGQVGNGTNGVNRLTPERVVTTAVFTALQIGYFHTCALDDAGAAYCWGQNSFGELGDYNLSVSGATIKNAPNKVIDVSLLPPSKILGNTTIGDSHTCALDAAGAAYCWGYNDMGQLGDGTRGTNRITPVKVATTTIFITMQTGGFHTCALDAAGAAYCWGYNVYGQLGDGTLGTDSNVPVKVATTTSFTLLQAGQNHTCALDAAGAAYCWGYNGMGQLGNGSTSNGRIPVKVATTTIFTTIDVGIYHTCALDAAGAAYCWGRNNYGQLGDDTYSQRITPVKVATTSIFTSIQTGENHTCALNAIGAVYCWGWNYYGQLGDGTSGTDRLTPVKVATTTIFISLQVGSNYTCALDINGAAYCWGSNSNGQLGDNTYSQRITPVKVATTTIFSALYAGYENTCASDASGAIYCWGRNNYGQLGNFSYAISPLPLLTANLTATPNPFYLSGYAELGVFTSSVLNFKQPVQFTNSIFNYDQPVGTAISVNLKFGETPTPDGSWITLSNISSTSDLSAYSGRYAQYEVNLQSDAARAISPQFQDFTINYLAYATTTQELISSIYDTGSAGNVINAISWTGATSTGSALKFQIQTSPDAVSWGGWQGPMGSSTYYTLNNASEAIFLAHTDALDDRYIQYKVIFQSDGRSTPVLSSIGLNYVLNIKPLTNLIDQNLSQDATGNIALSYQVKDGDTATPAYANHVPGFVSVDLQYCTANCDQMGSETWALASSSAITATAGSYGPSVAVNDTNFTNYTLAWNPNLDYDEIFKNNTSFKLRLKIDDGEEGNNVAYATSTLFTLDTKQPALAPVSLLATATPATLILPATDDSNFEMLISLNSDFSGATWQTYVPTSTLELAADPETVYIKYRDEFGNITPEVVVTTPESPINPIVQDVSNLKASPAEYALFVAWKKVTAPTPGFARYEIYRSTDQANWIMVKEIDDRLFNYYLDTTTNNTDLYYYRFVVVDDDGSKSYNSAVVNGKANGIQDFGEGGGGVSESAPVITNIATSSIDTTQAVITWDTDILSDSRVEYIAITGGDFTDAPFVGVATMANSSSSVGAHRVVVTNLESDTTYYFQVKSADPTGVTGVLTDGADGFTFTTLAGPKITEVKELSVLNNGASIIWTTDVDANSYVVVSTSSLFTTVTQFGQDDVTKNHLVVLYGLSQNKKYYYFVKSGIAKNDNGSDYYNFTTLNDTTKSSISGLTCTAISDTKLEINWLTDEQATTQVYYGATSNTYTENASQNTFDLGHSLILDSLQASSTYYFYASSTDQAGNTATSAEQSCFTDQKNITQAAAEAQLVASTSGLTTQLEVSQTKYDELKAERDALLARPTSSGGGGVIVIDKTDKVGPVISGVEVKSITATSASIRWITDEISNSFVKFGQTKDFGEVIGSSDLTKSHDYQLKNLEPSSTYYFEVQSGDNSGNLTKDLVKNFQTPVSLEAGNDTLKDEIRSETVKINENKLKQQNIEVVTKTLTELFGNLAKTVSLGVFESSLLTQLEAVNKLAQIIPAPILSGEPKIVTSPSTAKITWTTDKAANSLVAFVSDTLYALGNDNKVYSQVVGQSQENLQNHEVVIYNLKPETTYHYQLRSKGQLGPEARSRDFIFKTTSETLEIINHTSQVLSPQKAMFKWLTNLEANTQITYTPYRNEKLVISEAKTVIEKSYTTSHQVLLPDLDSGVIYQIELADVDQRGVRVAKVINTYSTTKEDLPPEIQAIQTESAISQGKNLRVQSVITWTTNEPTVCKTRYAEGAITDETKLTEDTQLESDYSKKHNVVITKFDSGKIYSFRVYCTDSGGNQATSGAHTVLTPRQSESVFDLIVHTLEETFGWVGKMK